jgi:N-acetylglucosamine-6-sulfatase
MRRRRAALVAALALAAVLVATTLTAGERRGPPRDPGGRPNVILFVTDDQTYESIPRDPPVMPYLQSQLEDPRGGWIRFPNAFLNTPLCCPSRATLLSGLRSDHTGVQNNDEGHLFDDSSTLATRLHGAGYTTGMVGKYLNSYPFGRGPYVPPGWDTWFAKTNEDDSTVYYDYGVVQDGRSLRFGHAPQDYATDVLGTQAARFVLDAPAGRPFFLEFTPSAPHRPWIPAPRDATADRSMPMPHPAAVGERDVADKPRWVRALPPLSAGQRSSYTAKRRSEYESLLAVDDALRSLDLALAARGALDDTVVVFMTDNGYSLGEHRWETKSCPYDPCVRTPFLVRVPGQPSRVDPQLVSNVDVVPTIEDLARLRPIPPTDGRVLTLGSSDHAQAPRKGVLMEWAGGSSGAPSEVPAWWGVRTKDFLYAAYADGEHELYDLTGRLGPADPQELHNRAGEPAYAREQQRLSALLSRLREQPPGSPQGAG